MRHPAPCPHPGRERSADGGRPSSPTDICSAAVVWGCVSAATAAVRTYRALLAVRVFLGVTEAVFFPGVIYFLSAWYTRGELGKRLAGLFVAQTIGSAFGGFIAAACLTLDGRHGIAGWRWLFIVCVPTPPPPHPIGETWKREN